MKRLIIWGTGNVAKEFISKGVNGEIIGFCETNKKADTFNGLPVYDADHLPSDYDLVIVANTYVHEIYEICQQKNINLDKVIFLFGIRRPEGFVDLNVIKEMFGPKNWTSYCNRFGIYQGTFWEDDIKLYNKLNTRENFAIQEQYLWPMISDKYAAAGIIGNYFWQDLWAAKLICKSGVREHFDIGSRIDGFIAHLLVADIDVTLIDIREFPVKIDKLHTIVDDATYLHQIPDESIESMSALCSLEHFGLGRYGDPIDPEACFKCFTNIQKKLKEGGQLYISLPIGHERVEFNAHRIFYANTIVECFSELDLEEFSCITKEGIEYNVELHKYDEDTHDGQYRYGLFHFIKRSV